MSMPWIEYKGLTFCDKTQVFLEEKNIVLLMFLIILYFLVLKDVKRLKSNV